MPRLQLGLVCSHRASLEGWPEASVSRHTWHLSQCHSEGADCCVSEAFSRQS